MRPYLDDLKCAGDHPSLDPAVLKKPAEKPPVNAPWKRRRPFSSVTIWSSSASGFFLGTASAPSSGSAVPKVAYAFSDSSSMMRTLMLAISSIVLMVLSLLCFVIVYILNLYKGQLILGRDRGAIYTEAAIMLRRVL